MSKSDTILKPCPFCGNPSVIKGSELFGHGEYVELVKCTNCSAQISDYYGKPAEKWNRRAFIKDSVTTAEAVIKELLYAHHHKASMMEQQYSKAMEMAEAYLNDKGDQDHGHLADYCHWRQQ